MHGSQFNLCFTTSINGNTDVSTMHKTRMEKSKLPLLLRHRVKRKQITQGVVVNFIIPGS